MELQQYSGEPRKGRGIFLTILSWHLSWQRAATVAGGTQYNPSVASAYFRHHRSNPMTKSFLFPISSDLFSHAFI